MKSTLLLIAFFSLLSASAFCETMNPNQFWKGEIILNDDTIKKGFVQVPYDPGQSKVLFKLSESAKEEKIKKKDIKLVKVISNSGKIYEFETVQVVNTIKGNSSIGSSLLLISDKNDYAKFYVSYGSYTIGENGEIYMLYRYLKGYDFPTLYYYIKKRDFEKARLIHMTNNVRGFRKGANAYFNEDPKLLERINNKELRFKDIDEIIKIYLETTKDL